ncbi:MAG: hypothetical protein L3J02_01445 [Henriciella sp.]|nr:hypothetical protein [Henriciella sp.]
MRKKTSLRPCQMGVRRGASYCAACQGVCEDCPRQINRPLTLEGWQVWDLAQRMGGQLRVVPGAVLGWDLGAAMALGSALGVNALVAAEFLPALEAVAVNALNEQIKTGGEYG